MLWNSCIAVCSIVARAGSILAPFVVGLQDIFPGILGVIFGGLGLMAGFLAWRLPETLGKDLPLTVEDAELRYSKKGKSVRTGWWNVKFESGRKDWLRMKRKKRV